MRNTPDPTSRGRHSLRPSLYMKAGCLIRKQGPMIRSVIPLPYISSPGPCALLLARLQTRPSPKYHRPHHSTRRPSSPPTSIDTSPVPPGVKRSYHFFLPLENTIRCSERCNTVTLLDRMEDTILYSKDEVRSHETSPLQSIIESESCRKRYEYTPNNAM